MEKIEKQRKFIHNQKKQNKTKNLNFRLIGLIYKENHSHIVYLSWNLFHNYKYNFFSLLKPGFQNKTVVKYKQIMGTQTCEIVLRQHNINLT